MSGWQVAGFTELRELGSGAQGRVVLARHDGSGLIVAVKYMYGVQGPQLADFRNEARMLRHVASPFVARLYDFVEEPGAGAAILMEAVDGVPLRDLLSEVGALAPEAALSVLKGSLLGLTAAHHAGVVHRDYKPANVVVEGGRSSKLIDFGIAVATGAGSRSGTPAYMAPEQWRGDPVTPATDVYAATCVFVECVTGAKPYGGQDLAAAHLSAPIPAQAVPEPLRALVEHGMAKRAQDRPESADAFVAELERVAAAGYGTDWESRGWRVLAGVTAALASLSPLAGLLGAGHAVFAAGSAAGSAVGSAAGSAAGSAVGSAVGGGVAGSVPGHAAGVASRVTGKSLLAKATASKAALAVAAVTAAGAVAAAVYVGASARPAAVPVGFAVEPIPVRTVPLGHGGALRVTGEYVQVTGLPTKRLTGQVNAALRGPVDQRLASDQPTLAQFGRAETYTAVDKATIVLRGPRLLSVRYDTDVHGNLGSGWNRVRTVTVDLTTGGVVPIHDLFAPATVTTAGLATLTQRIDPYLTGGSICGGDGNPGSKVLAPHHLDDFSAQIALGPHALQLFLDGPLLGFSEACGQQESDIPYSALTDLLSPRVLSLIRATGSPGAASPATGPAAGRKALCDLLTADFLAAAFSPDTSGIAHMACSHDPAHALVAEDDITFTSGQTLSVTILDDALAGKLTTSLPQGMSGPASFQLTTSDGTSLPGFVGPSSVRVKVGPRQLDISPSTQLGSRPLSDPNALAPYQTFAQRIIANATDLG
jgi:Protein kinase domain